MLSVPVRYIEIVETPFGQRVYIAGIKLAVEQIAAMSLNGSPVEWIAETYHLTLAQIYAALSYYYDHQLELEAGIQAARDLAQQIGKPL